MPPIESEASACPVASQHGTLQEQKCALTNWAMPNTQPKCTWKVGADQATSPHTRNPYPQTRCKILNNALEFIGNTPMIRMSNLMRDEGVECEILAKCEYFNAGGSVKDRIARRMVEEAEKAGLLKAGMTIIEPTSGNTGIGLALAAAIKGYRCIIVLPEKMSNEKVDALRALGAEIVRTPNEARFDAPESHIGVAARLAKEIPGAIILDQYRNVYNPVAHYDETAEEILDQCDGQIDVIVLGAGTGGTITGIGRKIKEKLGEKCTIVGVDPVGSILADPEEIKETAFYEVEGIGYDFVPTVLDRAVVDEWVQTTDVDSFKTARRMIRLEGLLCGGSSGSAMWAALQMAKKMNKKQRIVVLLPDGLRNYMSKYLSDKWMKERGFLDAEQEMANQHWWWNETVSRMQLPSPITVTRDVPISKAIDIMHQQGFDQLPVVKDDGGVVLGVVTLGQLITNVVNNKAHEDQPVGEVLYKQVHKVKLSTHLGRLSSILDNAHFALVVHEQQQFDVKSDSAITYQVIIGIVSRIDLLNFIRQGDKNVAHLTAKVNGL